MKIKVRQHTENYKLQDPPVRHFARYQTTGRLMQYGHETMNCLRVEQNWRLKQVVRNNAIISVRVM